MVSFTIGLSLSQHSLKHWYSLISFTENWPTLSSPALRESNFIVVTFLGEWGGEEVRQTCTCEFKYLPPCLYNYNLYV